MRILIVGTAGEGKSSVAKIISQALAAHNLKADVIDDVDFADSVKYDYPTRIQSIIDNDPIITIETIGAIESKAE